MKTKNKFINAFNGIKYAFKDQSVLIQVCCFLLATIASLILKVSFEDYLKVVMVSGLVIVSEMFNTCIERLCDYVCSSYDENIKWIKDVSAGAVMISAIVALFVALFIFMKYVGGIYYV